MKNINLKLLILDQQKYNKFIKKLIYFNIHNYGVLQNIVINKFNKNQIYGVLVVLYFSFIQNKYLFNYNNNFQCGKYKIKN